jgi:hypothetical protein
MGYFFDMFDWLWSLFDEDDNATIAVLDRPR